MAVLLTTPPDCVKLSVLLKLISSVETSNPSGAVIRILSDRFLPDTEYDFEEEGDPVRVPKDSSVFTDVITAGAAESSIV